MVLFVIVFLNMKIGLFEFELERGKSSYFEGIGFSLLDE